MSFIKHNASRFKDQLLKEVAGLELLRGVIESNDIKLRVPRVINVSEHQLELERVNAISPNSEMMATFGKELAKLHSIPSKRAGLEEDNYIGLNPQQNGLYQDWGSFFYDKRLVAQAEMIAALRVRNNFIDILSDKKDCLINWLNQHSQHMSLVHGDLWSGNVMFDERDVWLIDPAVYYADREVDLAMTEMFGGFNHNFYDAYDDVLPRSEEYDTKKVIYNLYHYLNHYNLFGEGYLSACQRGMAVVNSF